MVRSSSLLLGGRHVVHVSPSLGCCLHERLPGAAMRTPSPTRRRRQRRPSGCAMCQKLQQDGATATLGAAASARRSCILSLTRALQGQCAAAGTWSPSTGRNACRMLSCNTQTCETNLETSSRNFWPGSPAGVTQLMQRCVASTKSRTYCFPGGSDFTTQNGAARNVKGLLHHKCSSQQWPVVPLLFVCCLPAMHSLLCAAACLSLSSGGISVGRNMSTGAGATCVFVTLTDWANPALRLRVPRSVKAHVLPLHLILGFQVLFSHVCGGQREFRNPSISAHSDRLS